MGLTGWVPIEVEKTHFQATLRVVAWVIDKAGIQLSALSPQQIVVMKSG